jgi:uncharacterized protein YaeQ
MALKATIFKCDLNVSDLNRHHYAQYPLTLARHPSETDERMMLRIVAFALYADEQLAFTKGLSAQDEPELWLKNYGGETELWLDMGTPDEKRIRQACSKAKQVVILAYGGRTVDIWWQGMEKQVQRFDHLTVLNIEPEQSKTLAGLAEKNMEIQITIQDEQVFVSSGEHNITLDIKHLYGAA